MTKLLPLSALLVTLSATAARAESLEDKKYWQGQTDYMGDSLDAAEKACGFKLVFSWIDKATLRAKVGGGHSPNGVCQAIVSEIATICRDSADGKQAVHDKIHAVSCGFGNPWTLDLSAGTLRYMGNNDQANFSDWAKPWLMKHL